jgi:hypothetical protein
MRYVIMLVAVLGWIVVMTPRAEACSCGGGGTPCDAFGSAAAVFAGTVIATSQKERPDPADRDALYYRRVFKFSLDQSYLGVSGTEVEILTGSGGGDCGYNFKVGERYLVYAYRYQNQLITTICSRTKPFVNANEDLAFLGNLSSAAPGATIHGQLIRGRETKTEVAAIASDALIKIEGGNVRREVHPETDGRYRVSGLPPGRFKITLQLPETLFTDRAEQEVIVADRGCAPASYYVADNGRVSGRAVDAEGQPVKGLRIALIELDADPKYTYARGERTDSEGRFTISSIPAGRYVIAANNTRFPDPSDPTLAYPPVFYPGVTEQANAEVITIGPGEKLTGLDIRVPLRKSPSTATIQVVWGDGSPVSNAQLTLSDPTGEAGVGFGAQADEHGRFVINGFMGQQVSVEARSNREYVPLGNKFEPMERSEKVRVTLEKPKQTIRVVITRLR